MNFNPQATSYVMGQLAVVLDSLPFRPKRALKNYWAGSFVLPKLEDMQEVIPCLKSFSELEPYCHSLFIASVDGWLDYRDAYATTFGKGNFIIFDSMVLDAPKEVTPALIAHEVAHCYQYARWGYIYPEKIRKAEREADKLVTEWGYIQKSVPLWSGCRLAWPNLQEARAQYYAMLERPLRLQAA